MAAAAEEPEATAGDSGPVDDVGVGIQQEPYPDRHRAGADSRGDQHDRKVCPDLVPKQVRDLDSSTSS